MKKFLLLFILILGCQNLKDTENRTFKLTMMETKDISFVSNSFAPIRPKKENRQLEEIKKIPSDYKLLGIYQVDLQSSYKLSKYVLSDEKQKIDFVNDFGLYYLKYFEKISKIESYDCIFSACELENEKGDKFFIFDENNDEDFTNDPIADFESLKSDFIEGKNKRAY